MSLLFCFVSPFWVLHYFRVREHVVALRFVSVLFVFRFGVCQLIAIVAMWFHLGAGGRFPFPSHVWTPTGGWWANGFGNPPNWKRNTAIALASGFLFTGLCMFYCSFHEVNHFCRLRRFVQATFFFCFVCFWF